MTNKENRNVFKALMMTAFFIFSATAIAATDKMVESATIDRIKPFGELNIGKAPVMKASSGVDGKGTYQSACFACHGTGAAGSPKVGDKGAWKNRIAQGTGTLFDNAINGFKGMPAKGGNASLSDAAVKAAVEYMIKNSK